jgi:cytochrome bd ubiquinol oxidase subunit I
MHAMDAEMLARIQFAFTVGYHFIIVPLSIGLALMVVISETRYYKSNLESDKAASSFWIKLFTTTFALGVATGITMEFAFGTNWANYSRFVGDIFGAPLAAEGLFAFFLESTFLGVLLFGRRRVSRKIYLAAAWLVFIGANLSALWILIANSWQHTPAGYRIVDGRAVLTSFWAAAFNPSTAPRLVHTLAAAWITGGFLVAGIAAWYLLKRRHTAFARRSLIAGLAIGLIVSAAMPFIGHWQSLVVAKYQPVKMAAFETVYKTGPNAPLYMFGWVGEDAQGNPEAKGLAIPSGLSLMLGLSPDHVVKGLETAAPQDRPPLQLTFQSYHFMIALSFLFIAVMLLAAFATWRKKIEQWRWLLWLLVLCIPLPIIAAQLGWIATEVGRQPWIVQYLLRTSQGVSPTVSSGEVITTLSIFAVLYLILFIAWLRIFTGIVRKGPQEPVPATGGASSPGTAAGTDPDGPGALASTMSAGPAAGGGRLGPGVPPGDANVGDGGRSTPGAG